MKAAKKTGDCFGNGCEKWERLRERLRKNSPFFLIIVLSNHSNFTPWKEKMA